MISYSTNCTHSFTAQIRELYVWLNTELCSGTLNTKEIPYNYDTIHYSQTTLTKRASNSRGKSVHLFPQIAMMLKPVSEVSD